MVNHWILMEEATSLWRQECTAFLSASIWSLSTSILTHHAPGNFSILQPWSTPPHIFSFFIRGVHLPSFQSLSITLSGTLLRLSGYLFIWNPCLKLTLLFIALEIWFSPNLSKCFCLSKHCLGSIQFSCSVMSDSLRRHGLHHARPPLPVHYQLPEFTQTHVHWVSDAIQSSHPLSSPSPPAFSLSQHQGLFKWVSSSHQVAKVLEFQLQHQSFQWTFRSDFL